MRKEIELPKTLKVCEMGMGCKATKIQHFINFWHAPKKLLSLEKKV